MPDDETTPDPPDGLDLATASGTYNAAFRPAHFGPITPETMKAAARALGGSPVRWWWPIVIPSLRYRITAAADSHACAFCRERDGVELLLPAGESPPDLAHECTFVLAGTGTCRCTYVEVTVPGPTPNPK